MNRSSDIISIAEYIKNVLYFATVRQGKVLNDSSQAHYFTIDDQFVYENYYSDFGPLNLGCVYKYCMLLEEKLKQNLNRQIIIVHYTSLDPKKRANAAFLLGCYGIIHLSLPPKDALKPLLSQGQSYRPFQDATQGDSAYTISLMDCLQAISKARYLGLFNFQDFNYDEYERLGKIQGGDLNWIVPDKFLAFIGPVDYSVNLYHPPEMYIEYFNDNNVQIVIRLNKKLYDSSVNAGIVHYDLFFPDGSCPPRHILMKFLQISEKCDGAVAVHCKAGLGRTGSLIGCYLMKHYRMSAREAIGWMRICRPGSVIGQQQGWLEHLEPWLIKQGNLYRKSMHHDIDRLPKHPYGVYSIAEKTKKQKPVVFSKSPSRSPPPLMQRKTSSYISPTTTSSLNAAKNKNGSLSKVPKSPMKAEPFEWYVTSPPVTSYIQKIQQKGVIPESPSILSRRSGAGEPRTARSPVRGHTSRLPEQRPNTKEPSSKSPAGYYRVPTFTTTQGPIIKTVTDAKKFLMMSSIGNKEYNTRLNSAITVTPQYSTRITNFLTERYPADNVSRFTPSYFNSASKVSTQPLQRRRLGRSPSPPPMKMATEQSRATNTPVQKSSERYFVKDSRTNLREQLSCLNGLQLTAERRQRGWNLTPPPTHTSPPCLSMLLISSPMSRLMLINSNNRRGSIGAASLGAQREAPAPRRAPSVRSDERPLATQGDMLNSIKFQRRFRDNLQSDKLTTIYRDKKSVVTTASRDMSTVRSINSKPSSSGAKTLATNEYIIPRERIQPKPPRNFSRPTRSASKGRRNLQPSFY